MQPIMVLAAVASNNEMVLIQGWFVFVTGLIEF